MKQYLLHLLLMLYLVFANTFISAQCNNQVDYTALRAFYLSTNGDNWTDNSGWPDSIFFINNPTPSMDLNMDSWYGVSCEEFYGEPTKRVEYLNLNDNNLVGSLPSEIGQIEKLGQLRMNENSISGDLSTLSTLSILNTLDLSRTDVGGDLGSLTSTKLSILFLSDSDVFGNLSSLQPLGRFCSVSLENTDVTGNIAIFHGMPSLLTLDLNNTHVNGDISSLQQNPRLLEIKLNNTGVTGNLSNIVLSDDIYNLEFENLNFTGCWSSYFKSTCSGTFIYNFEGNQGVISNQGWIDFCDTGAGQCASNCPDYISKTCLTRVGCRLIGGTYQAVDSVSYSGRNYIESGVSVILNASESTNLSNGFYVQEGGLLQIDSEGCIQN